MTLKLTGATYKNLLKTIGIFDTKPSGQIHKHIKISKHIFLKQKNSNGSGFSQKKQSHFRWSSRMHLTQ